MVLAVYNRQLLNLVRLEYVSGCCEVGLDVCSHEVLVCHHVVDEFVEMTLKAKVAVCNDAYEMALFVHYRYTTDVILRHHIQGVLNGLATANCHRIVDHAVLGTLYDGYLTRLVFDRHVLVNNTDAAFACDGNSHSRLRYGVHGCCDKGHIQADVTRELGFQLYRLGQYL